MVIKNIKIVVFMSVYLFSASMLSANSVTKDKISRIKSGETIDLNTEDMTFLLGEEEAENLFNQAQSSVNHYKREENKKSFLTMMTIVLAIGLNASCAYAHVPFYKRFMLMCIVCGLFNISAHYIAEKYYV